MVSAYTPANQLLWVLSPRRLLVRNQSVNRANESPDASTAERSPAVKVVRRSLEERAVESLDVVLSLSLVERANAVLDAVSPVSTDARSPAVKVARRSLEERANAALDAVRARSPGNPDVVVRARNLGNPDVVVRAESLVVNMGVRSPVEKVASPSLVVSASKLSKN